MDSIQLASDDIAEDQVEEETSTSMQSNKVTDSSSTECTNEEELNLYLKSMETIFVKQLQKSLDLFADQQSRNPSACKHKTASSGQFKVLREGHWSRVDFRKRVDSFEDPKCLLANPWIRRYTTNCYDQNEIIKSPASSSRETIPSATLAQKFQTWRGDSATTSGSNNTEVMGQNFDDDDADAAADDDEQQLEEEE